MFLLILNCNKKKQAKNNNNLPINKENINNIISADQNKDLPPVLYKDEWNHPPKSREKIVQGVDKHIGVLIDNETTNPDTPLPRDKRSSLPRQNRPHPRRCKGHLLPDKQHGQQPCPLADRPWHSNG